MWHNVMTSVMWHTVKNYTKNRSPDLAVKFKKKTAVVLIVGGQFKKREKLLSSGLIAEVSKL